MSSRVPYTRSLPALMRMYVSFCRGVAVALVGVPVVLSCDDMKYEIAPYAGAPVFAPLSGWLASGLPVHGASGGLRSFMRSGWPSAANPCGPVPPMPNGGVPVVARGAV